MLKSERIAEEILSLLGPQLKSFLCDAIAQVAAGEEESCESLESRLRDWSQELCLAILEHLYGVFFADYKGTAIECECGSWQRFVDKRYRYFGTLFGRIRIPQAYYSRYDCERTASLRGSLFGERYVLSVGSC